MKSVMSHNFSQVPHANIQRSSFDRSHGHKTTFDAGKLVPIFVDEALPGDTFNLKMTAFARLATPIKPIMDNMYIETFFFAVPYRLVWDNWEKFNGQHDLTVGPEPPEDYLPPYGISPVFSGFAVGSLQDYMGIPTGVRNLKYSSLHQRAYNLIYNEWFLDQNLQLPAVVDTGDTTSFTDLHADYILRNRGKRHDYFTSCLPWPQKGEAVTVPLQGNAPVVSAGDGIPAFTDFGGTGQARTLEMNTQYLEPNWDAFPAGTDSAKWAVTALEADLSALTDGWTINQMREAFQLQRMLERDARGGTRYTEVIRAHFGVTSPDARLQRPEYLGGGSSPVNIRPVEQTQATDPTATPQGNLAALGTSQLHNHGFVKSFTEHCLILGLVNVRADLTYQQGLNRMFSRETRYDYYWPALSHLGEQAVLNKEIYAQGQDNPQKDEETFGYQERYAEYRYKPSLITGKFRSTYEQTLDVWHLSQEFENLPTLSDQFITDNPPVDRVIAVQGEPHFLFDSYFKFRCARPMPLYGVPGNIDRF